MVVLRVVFCAKLSQANNTSKLSSTIKICNKGKEFVPHILEYIPFQKGRWGAKLILKELHELKVYQFLLKDGTTSLLHFSVFRKILRQYVTEDYYNFFLLELFCVLKLDSQALCED